MDGGVSFNRLTPQAIVAYQIEKLRETLDYTQRSSPFYRRHLADYSTGQFSSLNDLSRLPFTTSDDLRNNPLRFLCVPQDEIARVVTLRTSGTTGESKRLFFTKKDLELTIDFFGQGMSTLVHPGDTVLILLPGNRPDSVGDLLLRGLRRINVKGAIHGSVQNIQDAVRQIIDNGVDSLVGVPIQVLAIARAPEGSVIGKGRIKSVLLSTDYVPQAIVKELSRLWGCRVFNHYGMTEMGLGGGVECEALAGYHLREADLYFEVVHPETGEPRKEGEIGEIVFTTLTRKGMPLIRYRTGDLARFLPEPCPCGTLLRRMECVRGRWDNRIHLADGSKLTLPEIDEVFFPLPWLINYDVTIRTEAGKDLLDIVVYVAPDQEPKANEVMDALMKIPTVREVLEGGYLQLAPVQFSRGKGFATGIAKRRIVDRRPTK